MISSTFTYICKHNQKRPKRGPRKNGDKSTNSRHLACWEDNLKYIGYSNNLKNPENSELHSTGQEGLITTVMTPQGGLQQKLVTPVLKQM